ncbi:MAG TPA: hypothetical protein VHA73_11740 [Acidimicrobiales bacterium]|nr:hypothetical protein [Acidimicrobiales bacterium]
MSQTSRVPTSKRRRRHSLAVAVAGLAAASLVASACSSSSHAATKPTTKVTAAPVTKPIAKASPAELETAYRDYQHTVDQLDSTKFSAFESAAHQPSVGVSAGDQILANAKPLASSWRDNLYAWDALVREVRFPAAVQGQVNQVLTANGKEIAALDRVQTVTNLDGLLVAADQVGVADADGLIASHVLDTALGHPQSAHALSVDRAQLAYASLSEAVDTEAAAYNPLATRYQDADRQGDLSAIKDVASQQGDLEQTLLRRLDQIAFPPQVAQQVAAYRTATQAVLRLDTKESQASSLSGLHQIDQAGAQSGPAQDTAMRDLMQALSTATQ